MVTDKEKYRGTGWEIRERPLPPNVMHMIRTMTDGHITIWMNSGEKLSIVVGLKMAERLIEIAEGIKEAALLAQKDLYDSETLH